VSLVKHNRYLVDEAEVMHKMTSLDHPDSRAKLRPAVRLPPLPDSLRFPSFFKFQRLTRIMHAQLVLVVNDGVVIVHKSEHSDKYTLLAFVRWFKKSTSEHAILNKNGLFIDPALAFSPSLPPNAWG
jgi:hypothetical protein